jgi:hypothetical protein
MLFPCLIWSETGRRVVLDDGVDVGLLPAVRAARCSTGWGVGGWQGSSRRASTRWCGAVGAFGGDGTALYQWVDGKASGGGAGSSPALWGMSLGCKKMKLGGSMSCRESRWCSRRTESGPGVVWVADDGG